MEQSPAIPRLTKPLPLQHPARVSVHRPHAIILGMIYSRDTTAISELTGQPVSA
jgi:hypothetical protein